MEWKELSGAERYRIVEMARRGEASVAELCRRYGMSRQTLSQAMARAEQAAVEALAPKVPGRKGLSEEATELASVLAEQTALTRDLDHFKTKYEIAMTMVDLQGRLLRGESLPEEEHPPRKKKKHRLRNPKLTTTSGPDRRTTAVAGSADGGGAGSEDEEP